MVQREYRERMKPYFHYAEENVEGRKYEVFMKDENLPVITVRCKQTNLEATVRYEKAQYAVFPPDSSTPDLWIGSVEDAVTRALGMLHEWGDRLTAVQAAGAMRAYFDNR